MTDSVRLASRSLAVAAVLLLTDGAETCAASEAVRGPIPAEVIRVIDGDTIEVRARIWLDIDVTTRVRLAGIDAPEIHGACNRERERAFVATWLAEHVPIALRDIRRDKYGGRVVADVIATDGDDLAQALLAAQLAHAIGAGLGGWCR